MRSQRAVGQILLPVDRGYQLTVASLAVAMMFLLMRPALGDEVEGDFTPVELTEQALAILVNAPESMGESLERIEVVLAEDPSELGGLDIEALERAAEAIEADDDPAAENALLEALGLAPLPDVEEEGESVLASPVLVRGPTERIEAGLRSPEWIGLVAAMVLAGAGTYLVRGKEGHP